MLLFAAGLIDRSVLLLIVRPPSQTNAVFCGTYFSTNLTIGDYGHCESVDAGQRAQFGWIGIPETHHGVVHAVAESHQQLTGCEEGHGEK